MLTNFVLLTSILVIVSAQMTRNCYTGTQSASDCAKFVDDFCNDVARDIIPAGDSNGHCYNISGGKRCDFIAWNSRTVLSAANANNCQATLNHIIRVCPAGGYGLPGPAGSFFTFTVDPNTGPCGQGVQAGS